MGYQIFKFLHGFFHRQFRFSSGRIAVSSAVKMFPGKKIHVEITLGTERNLDDFFVRIFDENGRENNAFYAQSIIDDAFGVAFYVVEKVQFVLC